MKRETFWWLVVSVVLVVVVVGCALSEEQIKAISTAAAMGASGIAKPIVQVAAPDVPSQGIDAIATTVGAIVGGVVGWILRMVKEKKSPPVV